MSEQNDYEKFLRGEYYPTGWKSEWRREFERQRTIEAYKPIHLVAPKLGNKHRSLQPNP